MLADIREKIRGIYMIEITLIKENEYIECEKILRNLPEWFGIESSIVNYVNDIKNMKSYIAKINNEIAGFITLNFHNKYTSEIQVMAVTKEYHGQKIGSKLVKYVEEILRNEAFEYLEVKTLSDSHPDKNYEKTRGFYFSNGFRPIEEMKKLWGEGSPCLVMIKKL